MDTILEVGKKAIDFSLVDQNGESISLDDFKGKQVLLSWHPLAWTGVCTDQMRALERHYQEFEKKNTVPLGISIDPPPSKSAWAKLLGLDKLKILADFYPLGEMSKSYGLFLDEKGFSSRANVLIDKDGIVKWVKVYDIPELPDMEEVLSKL